MELCLDEAFICSHTALLRPNGVCPARSRDVRSHILRLREDIAELCPIVHFRKNTALLCLAHMTAAFSSLRVACERFNGFSCDLRQNGYRISRYNMTQSDFSKKNFIVKKSYCL